MIDTIIKLLLIVILACMALFTGTFTVWVIVAAVKEARKKGDKDDTRKPV